MRYWLTTTLPLATCRHQYDLVLFSESFQYIPLPAAMSTDQYLQGRYPWLTRFIKWLVRHKLARLRYKYFSGYSSQAVFKNTKATDVGVATWAAIPATSHGITLII
ncbi:MAG: hypothetical protein ABFS24_04400 [Pseudomonadota bacterium]